MQKTNKILIIGAPRSGTTLLSGLLTGSEQCYQNLPECTLITQIIEHYYNVVNYSDKERFHVYAKDKEKLFETYHKHVENMLSIVFENFGKTNYKFIVFKDPLLTNYIDLIPSFFGTDSKIIFIVRNPKAIIASMLKVELKKNINNQIRLDELIKQITEDTFNYFYIVHNSKVYKKGIYTVSYENIVSDNKAIEFLKLQDYIGYKFEEKPFKRNAFKFDQSDPTYSENYGKNIIKLAANNEVFSASHIELIEHIFCGMNEIYKWW